MGRRDAACRVIVEGYVSCVGGRGAPRPYKMIKQSPVKRG